MTLEKEVEKEYDERFDERDRELLRLYNITPEAANKYDQRIDNFSVLKLSLTKTPPETANTYHGRFEGEDIEKFQNILISPEEANPYATEYDAEEIITLIREGISPKKANRALTRYGNYMKNDIIEFLKHDITPKKTRKYRRPITAKAIKAAEAMELKKKTISKYDRRFSLSKTIDFLIEGIPPEKANPYADLNIRVEPEKLIAKNITPEEARKKYDDLRRPIDKQQLIREGMTPEEAKEIPSRLTRHTVKEAIDNDLDRKGAISLLQAYRGWKLKDAIRFQEAGVPPEKVKGKRHMATPREVINMQHEGIDLEQGLRYCNIHTYHIKYLLERGVPPEKANQYTFGKRQPRNVKEYVEKGIEPESVNKHNTNSLLPRHISALIQEGIGPEEVENGLREYSADDIIFIRQKHIPLEYAEKYIGRGRKGQRGISQFISAGVPPEKANEYPWWIPAEHIIEAIEEGVTAQETTDYKDCMPTDIIELRRKEIGPQEALQALKDTQSRFEPFQIPEMLVKGVDPQEANKYSRIFKSQDVIELSSKNIRPEEANNYPQEFLTTSNIIQAAENGITSKDSRKILATHYKKNPYLKRQRMENIKARWTQRTTHPLKNESELQNIIALTIRGITHQEFKKLRKAYDERFDTRDIAWFKGKNIGPKTANEYPKHMSAPLIIESQKKGIGPDKIRRYSNKIRLPELINAIEEGIGPEEANKYQDIPWDKTLINILKNHKEVDLERYDNEFSIREKYVLIDSNITPKQAKQALKDYDKRFTSKDITFLLQHSITPEKANEYEHYFSGKEIAVMESIGMKSNGDGNRLLEQIIRNTDFKREPDIHKLTGTGKQATIIQNDEEQSAYKIGFFLSREVRALKALKMKHEKTENIINLKDNNRRLNLNIIKVDYIDGPTLEQKIKKKGTNPTQALSYARDIMDGLVEMRRAGVWYHNDLRPANVMIDERQDKAIIIDLGQASFERQKEIPENPNRRYGGANDLTSLGQVMYKMTTGEHLFAQSKTMEMTIHAQEIKDQRDQIYENPKLLQKHLQKVEDNIPDQTLANTIKKLLTAKDYHYKNMQRHLQRITVEKPNDS